MEMVAIKHSLGCTRKKISLAICFGGNSLQVGHILRIGDSQPMLGLPLRKIGTLCIKGSALANVNVFFKPVGAVLPRQFTPKVAFPLG